MAIGKTMPVIWSQMTDFKDLMAVHHAANFVVCSIPWHVIETHEAQAQKNHRQSLDELRGRGGLSRCEAVAIIEDRPWRDMTSVEANARLFDLIITHGETP